MITVMNKKDYPECSNFFSYSSGSRCVTSKSNFIRDSDRDVKDNHRNQQLYHRNHNNIGIYNNIDNI